MFHRRGILLEAIARTGVDLTPRPITSGVAESGAMAINWAETRVRKAVGKRAIRLRRSSMELARNCLQTIPIISLAFEACQAGEFRSNCEIDPFKVCGNGAS